MALPKLDEASTNFFLSQRPDKELTFAVAIYRDRTMALFGSASLGDAHEETFPAQVPFPVQMAEIDSLTVLYTTTATWTWWTSGGVRKCWWI